MTPETVEPIDLPALLARVERLESLEAENRVLRARLAAAAPAPPAAAPHSPLSRRGLIGGAAAAAAGIIAGTLAVAHPAAAADPNDLVLGAPNTAADDTSLHHTASTGDGFAVVTDGDRAIVGTAAPDNDLGEGVAGVSALGVGVHGHGTDYVGVWGTGYYGVMAQGDTFDLTFNGVHPNAPTPLTASYWGDTYMQSTPGAQGTLWVCVQSSNLPVVPGKWRRVVSANSAGALTVLPSPIRVYDSRPGTSPTTVGPKAKLLGNTDQVVDCTLNSSGVPADATAVIINLTAVNQDLAGYMSVRADGTTYANTSNLNWDTINQTVANSCTVACGPNAKILVRCGDGPTMKVDFIVDIVGYYR